MTDPKQDLLGPDVTDRDERAPTRRPDPDAPGNFLDDETSDSVPEPNEPA